MEGGISHYDHDYCNNWHLFSYVIFDQLLKITFNPQAPSKNPLPPFYSLPLLKIQKVQVTPFCQHWTFFGPPPHPPIPCRKGGGRGGRTLWLTMGSFKRYVNWIMAFFHYIHLCHTLSVLPYHCIFRHTYTYKPPILTNKWMSY